MTNTESGHELTGAFASGILNQLQKFWFAHLADPSHIVVPSTQDLNVWFVDKSDEFDNACRTNFGSVLDTIISHQSSAERILTAANPNTALEWMALILLLDQIPRNCYRGMEAAKISRVFDPLALAIALKAREFKMHQSPEIRFRLGYRLWFFMPMEHAEDLEMQQLMVEEQKDRFRDMDLLMQGKIDAKDDVALACRNILVQRKEELEDCRRLVQKAVDEHHDDIQRFGRFPYRNLALGRTSTREEQDYLDAVK